MANHIRGKFIYDKSNANNERHCSVKEVIRDLNFERYLERQSQLHTDSKIKTKREFLIKAGIDYAYLDFLGDGICLVKEDISNEHFFEVGYNIGNRKIYAEGLLLGQSGFRIQDLPININHHHSFIRGYFDGLKMLGNLKVKSHKIR